MNLKKIVLLLFISISTTSVFAQKDGYWDKERAFNKEIVVSARERIVVKTEDLPVGTTEVVFRITLLDQNQQMANSLVSVLKAIPDPTGISQGSAGAVFLVSKISGDDKCKYAIFSNAASAAEYKKSGDTDNACFLQEEAVSKDAKRLSIDKSLCLLPNSNAMWFGFESKNWIMNQKIVLEVVPWVNNRLSSGWTLENRKLVINQCKTSDLAKKIINSDDFCVCVLNKIQKLKNAITIEELCKIIKEKLCIPNVRVVGDTVKLVKSYAICTGSGMSFSGNVKKKADVFITGDLKYHESLDASELNQTIIDLGHYESEYLFVELLEENLKTFFDGTILKEYGQAVFKVI